MAIAKKRQIARTKRHDHLTQLTCDMLMLIR